MTTKYQGLEHRAGHDPRAAALLTVAEVLTTETDSQAALDRRIKAAGLMPGDKALCTELTYGLLRRHLRLEWFLRQKLSRPEKLPAEALLILELAAYELAHTRIPAHASLNWAVGLVRNRFGRGLAGLANGVLRGFQRGLNTEYENPAFYLERLGADRPDRPDGPEDPAFLACFHGMPEWIVRLWLAAYGPQKTLLCLEAAAQPAPLGLRVNARRREAAAVRNELKQAGGGVFWLEPDLAALPGGGAGLPLRRWQEQGLVSRQSAAAYQALWALRPRAWEGPIWDACAGRGGKSLALLEQGLTVDRLSDVNAVRLAGFDREFDRLFGPADGLIAGAPPRPEVRVGPAGGLPPGLPPESPEGRAVRPFGTVLLDAPCSGLGTLSHRPEIRWRRSRPDLEKLCAVQADLLETGAAALRPGGRLVYLTCTLNPAENQDQVDLFLKKRPEFKTERIWDTLAELGRSPQAGAMPAPGEFFWGALLVKTL